MHVCHFCDTTFETDFFRNIVGGLTSRGVTVSLVELGPGPPPTWLGQFSGVEYLNLGASNKILYLSAAYRLSRFLSSKNVDILHTHLFFAGIIGLLAKRLRPKAIVALMRHHTSVVRMLGSRVHIAADKWMAEKADHVMTVSEAARLYMREIDGIARDDIEIVHIGFDFEKVAPRSDLRLRVRDEFGFGADDFVIGYVGNFVPGKGHLQLVHAFEQVSKEISTARLFLVGGGMLSDVHSAAEGLGPNRVIFAGWRDDVPACLNAMDLFIQPSLSEAFSQVLIEAMGTGLPVIATDVGGAPEVIDNGENGILIEAGRADTIAAQIRRVYYDMDLRTRLAAAGRRSVVERFTAERMVDRLFTLYSGWLTDKK
ncbi:MAG TPA: glycosyltransferase family 4 protein [Pyrinomonadaceae bacterium]|nr:glycosyltransferase family 4 protein [Pyrinomonadaceae bacterium]